jgi:hypothetical protein
MAALLLTLLTVHSGRQLWLVYTVMLGYGLSYVLIDAAEARLVTSALPADALGGLNGARMSAQEATKLLAPLIGAGLFASAGGPAVAAVAGAPRHRGRLPGPAPGRRRRLRRHRHGSAADRTRRRVSGRERRGAMTAKSRRRTSRRPPTARSR